MGNGYPFGKVRKIMIKHRNILSSIQLPFTIKMAYRLFFFVSTLMIGLPASRVASK